MHFQNGVHGCVPIGFICKRFFLILAAISQTTCEFYYFYTIAHQTGMNKRPKSDKRQTATDFPWHTFRIPRFFLFVFICFVRRQPQLVHMLYTINPMLLDNNNNKRMYKIVRNLTTKISIVYDSQHFLRDFRFVVHYVKRLVH